jgi:hypothetical protein
MWILLLIYTRFAFAIMIVHQDFEGAILHHELSLSINILSIQPLLRYANGQKSALSLCHNRPDRCKHCCSLASSTIESADSNRDSPKTLY